MCVTIRHPRTFAGGINHSIGSWVPTAEGSGLTDLTPDSSPGRPCARAPQLIACSLFDTWTRHDHPQPISPSDSRHQMEPPSPASNARPITVVCANLQNPAIPLALWIESSMSVSRARARLASKAEPARPIGFLLIRRCINFPFQIREPSRFPFSLRSGLPRVAAFEQASCRSRPIFRRDQDVLERELPT